MKQIFKKPMLFGHRGSSADHPENTIPSFADCLEHRIDGIELDVHLCKSGELVVVHDDDLKRVAQYDKKIADLTYEELTHIDVGNGEHVPLLKDVFDLGGMSLYYDIEIKAGDTKNLGLEKLLFGEIQGMNLASRCMISSFNPVSLLRFKRISRNTIPTALIYSDEPSVPKMLRHGGGRYIARPSYLKPSKQEFANAPASYQTCPWTIDDRDEAKKFLESGASGIISNDPKALKDLFIV